ncbi:prolyl 4-hydroxylase subunit alpha-1-like [Oppia nitens]|uniref:prolyl 4-hydroxylase subunit alpha-1-like n=1 Tax=Oppia nitens TaxID=1686743 RepID=UPI0023DC66FC|nr:prolyl 4-hydroxylase subunit alpha-1-like [Oppia nitens]
MRTILVFATLCLAKTNGDIFSSTAHLQSLMHLERHLVSEMSDYLTKMEAKLYEIKSYLHEFAYTAGREEFAGKFATDEIVGNPIQAFQLVKRLTINWRRIENIMAKENLWNKIEELTDVYQSFMPSQEDLHGAALALVRLQDTYNLNMTDLAKGQILGYQTNVEMTARDCLYLGKHSFNNGYYGHSIEWFEEALIRAHREDNRTASVEEIMPFYNMAVEITDQNYTDYFNENRIKGATKLKIVEGESDDYHNYQALCRGENLKTAKEEKNLKCYLTNKGNPLLILQPIKVEVFNENPLVVMFHDLMTEYEMQTYKDLAIPMLTRARVQTENHDDEVSKVRTSQTAWFSPQSHKMVANLNHRVEAVTGLSVDMDKSHCELVQIANYGMGGHYVPHYDYLIVDRPEDQRHLAPAREVAAGDRTATLMFYLSDVIKGGSTVFPRLGTKVTPEKGAAVFWYNLYRNGEGIEDTVHGACPVLMGEKWVANYWIREIGQTFNRRCSLNPNE